MKLKHIQSLELFKFLSDQLSMEMSQVHPKKILDFRLLNHEFLTIFNHIPYCSINIFDTKFRNLYGNDYCIQSILGLHDVDDIFGVPNEELILKRTPMSVSRETVKSWSEILCRVIDTQCLVENFSSS